MGRLDQVLKDEYLLDDSGYNTRMDILEAMRHGQFARDEFATNICNEEGTEKEEKIMNKRIQVYQQCW